MASHSKISAELTEAELRRLRLFLSKIKTKARNDHAMYNYASKMNVILNKGERRIKED